MNRNYIEQLIKCNRNGMMEKLININKNIWSVNDYVYALDKCAEYNNSAIYYYLAQTKIDGVSLAYKHWTCKNKSQFKQRKLSYYCIYEFPKNYVDQKNDCLLECAKWYLRIKSDKSHMLHKHMIYTNSYIFLKFASHKYLQMPHIQKRKSMLKYMINDTYANLQIAISDTTFYCKHVLKFAIMKNESSYKNIPKNILNELLLRYPRY